jgi:hypothetical protein
MKNMKTKCFFLALFSVVTFTTFAQSGSVSLTDSNNVVTQFKLETGSIDYLKDFDWISVKEFFEANEDNQEISLEFSFINDTAMDTSKIRVDNFKVKVTGKTSDLDNLIDRLKRTFEKVAQLDGKEKE